MFNPTYSAQLKASRKTGGIIPHPAVVTLKVPPGPVSWQTIAAAGRPVQSSTSPTPTFRGPATTDFSGTPPAYTPYSTTYYPPARSQASYQASYSDFSPVSRGSYGSYQSREEGLIKRILDRIIDAPPLCLLAQAAEEFDSPEPLLRLIMAIGCAVLVLMSLRGMEVNDTLGWVAIAGGGIAGAWILPRILTKLFAWTAQLLAIVFLVVACGAAIGGLIYVGASLLAAAR